MPDRPCKKCFISEQSGKAAEDIRKLLAALPEKEKASHEEYHRRLEICKNCEKLSEGTCLACGCYVELRAAKKDGKCPEKKF